MTIPESGISRPRGDVDTIEVKLQEFEQLFNTIDPSPFHEKDLDHHLEEFIVSCATEYPLHVPKSEHAQPKQIEVRMDRVRRRSGPGRLG